MSGTNNIFTLWRHFDGSSFNNTHIHGSTRHAWYIGGVEKVRVHSDGNVGIGTISPYAPLDVFHNGSATYKDMIMARSHSGGFAVQCSDIDASNPTWILRTYSLENMIISPWCNRS